MSLLLLVDCRAVFDRLGTDRVQTKTLIDELLGDEERPWRDMGRSGKALNAHGLGRLLHPYQIRPTLMKFEGVPGRGYRRTDFESAWDRYLPACQRHLRALLRNLRTTADRELRRQRWGVTSNTWIDR